MLDATPITDTGQGVPDQRRIAREALRRERKIYMDAMSEPDIRDGSRTTEEPDITGRRIRHVPVRTGILKALEDIDAGLRVLDIQEAMETGYAELD